MTGPTVHDDVDPVAIRAELEARARTLRAKVEGLAARPEPGSGLGFGKRIGDGTIEAVSRLTEIGVGGSLEVSLARTERALAKLDDGTYGACDRCGAAIAVPRLQAMPDAVLCLACAAAERRAAPPRRR